MHNHDHINLNKKHLFITFLLNISIFLVQIIGGVISGSMALISDAMHNLSDSASLILTIIANKISEKEKNTNYTFGYKRIELLAAIVNSVLLLVIGIFIIKEAVVLFGENRIIDTNLMAYFALFGVFANLIGTLLLKKDSEKNYNIKSAYLHLLTDVLSSVAVIVGAIVMKYFGLLWVDLLLSIVIAIYMIYESWEIILNSTRIFLMRAPKDLDLNLIIENLYKNFEIKNIHHVHIWQMDENNIHIEFHAEFFTNDLQEISQIYDKIEEFLHDNYEITHLTIQAEYSRCCDKRIIAEKEKGH
ncbi:MAG TPA: cation diffusion facilitator family transporter [Ignavibacteriales bacterium]|nr:cation diffusion facilitator family transporter [Ignavibacteriales bacterium]